MDRAAPADWHRPGSIDVPGNSQMMFFLSSFFSNCIRSSSKVIFCSPQARKMPAVISASQLPLLGSQNKSYALLLPNDVVPIAPGLPHIGHLAVKSACDESRLWPLFCNWYCELSGCLCCSQTKV
jgi:hypothetical protein